MVSIGIPWKCFCIKDLFVSVRDIHKKNLQADSSAKECQLNRAKARKNKPTLINILKKRNDKKREA